MIIMSLCQDSTNIGSVCEFSESKAPNVFIIRCCDDIFLMFLCAQIENTFHVQEQMNSIFYGKTKIIIDVST